MPDAGTIDTIEAQLAFLMEGAKDHINSARLAASQEERDEHLDAALSAINVISDVFNAARKAEEPR